MPEEAKVKFMQELKDKHGKQAVVAHAIDTLKSYERTTERYAFNGEFWALNGYDTKRIEESALPHKVTVRMESKLTDLVRERPLTAMNLIIVNPLFPQLPGAARIASR